VALSSDPANLKEVAPDRLRLRPIPRWHQSYYVFMDNRSERTWNVIVEVHEGDRVKVRAGEKEKPLVVKAGSSQPVPSMGGPAAKDGVDLPELAGPIRLVLRNAPTGEVLNRLSLPVTIASPRDYLQVTGADFTPASPGQPNLLTIVVNPRPGLNGPP